MRGNKPPQPPEVRKAQRTIRTSRVLIALWVIVCLAVIAAPFVAGIVFESWGRVLGDTRTHGVFVEAGVYCEDNPCVSIVEYKNKCIRNAISFEGCTAEELADVGRVFLNAAIAVRKGKNERCR